MLSCQDAEGYMARERLGTPEVKELPMHLSAPNFH